MTTLAKITDHAQKALDRLLSQFEEKPKVEGFVGAFTGRFQDIEDTLFDLFLLRIIDEGFGAQLDVIGEIVGIARGGRSDVDYRIAIYGQIGENTSKGLMENVISVIKLVSGAGKVHAINLPPGVISLMLNTVPTVGDQLLADADMEALDVSAWTAVNSATLTKESLAPQEGIQSLRVAYNGVTDPGASQTVLEVGRTYWMNGFVRTQDLLGQVPVVKNGAATIFTGVPFTAFYEFDIVFEATDETITFGSDAAAADFVEYDDFSMFQLDFDALGDVFDIAQRVVAGGVRVDFLGWYEQDEAFSFAGDPEGLGFGDFLDPTVGGKYASLI